MDSNFTKNFEALVEVIRKLRSEEGCPWDKAQTHDSLKPSCIEEACEVVAGINLLTQTGESASLKEELGDQMMGIIMQALIAEEEGYFTLGEVMDGIAEKMIRRHPHVFGREAAAAAAGVSVEELKTSWEDIKKQEKKGKEWMDDKLPQAFLESKDLIDRAAKRKGYVL